LKIVLVLSVLFAALALVADTFQTLSIARDPEHFSEINVVLGKHPTVERVLWYFAICIVLVLIAGGVAYWLERYQLGAALFMLLCAFEVGVVLRNRRLGVRI
jgi:hypothetical protein